jgi:hypothetical protein
VAQPKRAHELCPIAVVAVNSNSLVAMAIRLVEIIAGSKRMMLCVNFIQGWILINRAISALPSRELVFSVCVFANKIILLI